MLILGGSAAGPRALSRVARTTGVFVVLAALVVAGRAGLDDGRTADGAGVPGVPGLPGPVAPGPLPLNQAGAMPGMADPGGMGGMGGMPMVTVPAAAYVAGAPDLDRTGWVATADSADAGHPASAALDGSGGSYWQTSTGAYPHVLTIDTGGPHAMTGLRYTPRADSLDGHAGSYVVDVSSNGTTWTTVVSGVWAADHTDKTASFSVVTARYVRLTAQTPAGGAGSTPAAAGAAEINLVGAPSGAPLDRTGWSAVGDSTDPNNPAGYALDNNPGTFWHTEYSQRTTSLPHTITIDTKAVFTVTGLGYTPRQDDYLNGTIGRYQVTVSTDGTTWSDAVASGTWPDTHAAKSATFAPVQARYVRLTALTESGGRGPWSSAAELQLFGPSAGPVLGSAGWRFSTDSAESGNPVAAAFDGDLSTFWHTNYYRQTDPLPHRVVIDARTSYRFDGLVYTPRQDSYQNGTIGQFTVETSPDGTTWTKVAGGVWADDRSAKTVAFPATTARYVRLTALSEAGNRGPWSSAAEINLTGTELSSGARGRWSTPIGLPIVPVSAILLPNDKVLTFSAYSNDSYDLSTNRTQVSIFDVSTGSAGQREVSNTQHEMFCTGLSVLADGRVLITGGSSPSTTTIYDPVTDTFTRGPNMQIPRGYQTSVTLSDGRVFTIGGSWSGGEGGKDAEVLSADGTTWSKLPGDKATSILTDDAAGVYRADNHAWLFATANGGVFQAGPSRAMNWFTTTGAGVTTSAGTRADAPDAMNGNAVMYDTGRILTLGGSPSYSDSDATSRAYTVDVSGGAAKPVVVKRTGDLGDPRAFANSTVLPDGTVLVTGGQTHALPFSDATSIRDAELWSPATGTFRELASEAIPRNYHSFSLLLADGRVLVGGGGLCGTCATNHPDVEIFTPPYLLNDDGSPRARPAIVGGVPTSAAAGSRITVRTDKAVSSWAMVRTGSATHSIDSDQRRITLAATSTATNTYQMTIPTDRGTSVPGSYLLFALDANGTPSKGVWFRVP